MRSGSLCLRSAGLMLPARIGELEAEGADLRLVERRQDHLHGHVVIVRPSQLPQQTCSRAIRRKTVEAAVQRRHVLLDQLGEVLVRQVLVQQDTLHREVRRIDLQDKSGLDDPGVLDVQLAGDRIEIVLMRGVVRVQHGRRDDARRGRIHEEFAEPGRSSVPTVSYSARSPRRSPPCRDISARRSPAGRRTARLRDARHHPLGELRKLDELLAVRPLRHAARSVHALRDVGLKSDTPLLAVIGAVDPDLGFLVQHVRDARIGELVQPSPGPPACPAPGRSAGCRVPRRAECCPRASSGYDRCCVACCALLSCLGFRF